MMETSDTEGKRLLRSLELKAFRGVVDALRAQGSLTLHKQKVLKSMATTLKVGDERCRSEIRRAVNDNLLNFIAQSSTNEQNSEEKWRIESARRIARVPMVTESTAFTALADNVSDWVISQNQLFIERDSSLISVLESKKNRADANASRYCTTKMFAPLLSTEMTNFDDIAIELEKMKSQQAGSHKNSCHSELHHMPTRKPSHAYVPEVKLTSSYNVVHDAHKKVNSDIDNNDDIITKKFAPKVIDDVRTLESDRIRPAKSRTKTSQKCSHLSKILSPHGASTQSSKAEDIFFTSASELGGARKRQKDNNVITSVSAADDDQQPEEKRMKCNDMLDEMSSVVDNAIEKIPKDVYPVEKTSLVGAIGKKSSVVDTVKKGLSSIDVLTSLTNDSISDGSEVASVQSSKSTVSFNQVDACPLAEKDFIPHTFNLIPTSRRLKLLKMKEQLAKPIPSKPNNVVVISLAKRDVSPSLHNTMKTDHSNGKGQMVEDVIKAGQTNKFISGIAQSQKACSAPLCEQKKETDEKAKSLLPVLSRSKKTLSLLGNIVVHNLNAKNEQESLEKCHLPNYENDDGDKNENINEGKEVSESELSEFDSFSIEEGSSEYSDTFDDNDVPNVIEYWDNDDDDDDIHVDDDYGIEKSKNGYENGIVFDVDCVSDDDVRHNQHIQLYNKFSNNSQITNEIVEEIIEDDEFLNNNDVHSDESGDNKNSPVFSKVECAKTANSSVVFSGDKSNDDRTEKIVCAEKTAKHKLECDESPPVNTSTVKPSFTSILKAKLMTICKNNSTEKSRQTNVVQAETSSPRSVEIESQVEEEAAPERKDSLTFANDIVSNMKPEKLTTVKTTGTLFRKKEASVVSPNVSKTVLIDSKDDKKSPSVFIRRQTPPNPKCIGDGQTISISNARLIGATPKSDVSSTNSISGQRSNLATGFPKITVYSSTKVPNSGGLRAPPGAPKCILLPRTSKTVEADIGSSQKRALVQPSKQFPIPKKVCRLYDLINLPESTSSNSSSSVNVKKMQPNEKTLMNVSST